jgi:acetyl esterase
MSNVSVQGAEVKTILPTAYGRESPDYQVVSGHVLVQEIPSPAVVFLNSGGWNSSPQAPEVKGTPQSHAFNKAGYSTFFVSHRSLHQYRWPAQLEDVRRAIQFIRSQATAWTVDPGRIAVTGRSSGGHLSMMAAFLPDPGDPRSTDPVKRESSRVQAVIQGAGPADLALMARHLIGKEGNAGGLGSILGQLLGVEKDQLQSLNFYQQLMILSPINYITAESPPVFLQYEGPEGATGPNDPRMQWEVHSPISGVLLAQRLEDFGVPFELFMVPNLREREQESLRRRIDFLREHLLCP